MEGKKAKRAEKCQIVSGEGALMILQTFQVVTYCNSPRGMVVTLGSFGLIGCGFTVSHILYYLVPRWWFQIFFIFTPLWGRFPF